MAKTAACNFLPSTSLHFWISASQFPYYEIPPSSLLHLLSTIYLLPTNISDVSVGAWSPVSFENCFDQRKLSFDLEDQVTADFRMVRRGIFRAKYGLFSGSSVNIFYDIVTVHAEFLRGSPRKKEGGI